MALLTYCVPCLFGLEGLAAAELRRLGMENVRAQDRRVFFDGRPLDLARANLRLRTGERVMILLGRFEAPTFDALYEGVRALPLEDFVPRDGAFPVKGYSLSSALHSVPDCQAIVKKAAADRLGQAWGLTWLPETGPLYQIHFSIMKDLCEVFLDTSGPGLHKRGYRATANLAPLHETMAAALVELSKYRGKEVFWDPFCGSGTILIEAALTARNRVPGLGRGFAAERWPLLGPELWQGARTEALDGEFRGPYRLFGGDIDRQSLAIAAHNARKAGVEKDITWREADARRAAPPAERGVLVTNPPYGERMLERREAQALLRAFGRRARELSFYRLFLLSSDPEFEALYGRKAQKRRKLYNGRLQCNVYQYEEGAPRAHGGNHP